jgi:hypothetical protein
MSFDDLFRKDRHNADEPQPKRLTGENRANREGNDWEFLFSFLISVYSVFSVLKIFANTTLQRIAHKLCDFTMTDNLKLNTH